MRAAGPRSSGWILTPSDAFMSWARQKAEVELVFGGFPSGPLIGIEWGLRRERNGPHPPERLPETGDHDQVGVLPHARGRGAGLPHN